MKVEELKKWIRDVPDFPKPGILYKDITPLLGNPMALQATIDAAIHVFKDKGIHKIAGIESRGFIFGVPLSLALGAGFVPIRKVGKLPYKKVSESYDLEYGSDTLEIHEDAILPGEKVLVVDDLLATGGTAGAVCRLVDKLKGDIVACSFVVELGFLNGREKLPGREIVSLIKY